MIDLYTSATPNGWKATITLEELELPYTLHNVNLSEGEQRTPAFVALNPNGRIPVIVDREAGDFPVFESGAILIYLAEKAGKLMPTDAKGRSVGVFPRWAETRRVFPRGIGRFGCLEGASAASCDVFSAGGGGWRQG